MAHQFVSCLPRSSLLVWWAGFHLTEQKAVPMLGISKQEAGLTNKSGPRRSKIEFVRTGDDHASLRCIPPSGH